MPVFVVRNGERAGAGRADESAELRWLDLSGGNAELAHDLSFILRFIKRANQFAIKTRHS
jgi:hypothetical protein